MKIKKSTSIMIIVSSIILILALLFLFRGVFKYLDFTNYSSVNLYFANAEKTDLKSEIRPVKKNSDYTEYIECVINELLNGPVDKTLSSIIPVGTKLINVAKNGFDVTVNLTNEYLSNEKTDNILARNSIAKTLFDLEKINSVQIMINGETLKDSSGKEVGFISKSNLLTGVSETKQQKINVTTYFSDNEAMYLVAETRTVTLVENSLERAIINELIKGPSNANHLAVIPPETKLISVETKEGICFVNFSEEFITKHSGGSSGEAITVYSIVNSLTELETIDKVQFMVAGNKIDNSHFEFYEPIERDESWIKK